MHRKLELIKISGRPDMKGKWYWTIDEKYEDNLGGAYGNSVNYDSDKEAIKALFNNEIDWEVKDA